MAYIDIISLATARNYLRIDDDFTEDDESIVKMINASLSFIEKRTNHIMFPRDKDYFGSCSVNVYDYPINDPDPITDNYSLCKYSTYSNFRTIDGFISLNVGYIDPLDIPSELIECAMQMLKVWYYDGEKQTNTTLIPESVMQSIDINRRFLL